ncbi:MAG: hypothetical protein ACRD0G_06895 [Acidimicrobiales bacterium]
MLVFAAGLAVVAVDAFDLDDDEPTVALPTTSAPVVVRTVPDENQAFVTGTAVSVVVEAAPSFDSLPTPLVVTTAERGFGSGATIDNALLDGEQVSIVWDAGRPLNLNGEAGALLLGPVNVTAAPGQLTVGFPDGDVLGFAPGVYSINNPVAVGTGGLGEPRDTITFEATPDTTIAFRGGATTGLSPTGYELTGPGRVVLDGAFEVETSASTTSATHVELTTGPFELALLPTDAGDGWTVDATLQGELIVQ